MGSGKHVNDLTVETNSQCFICSEKVLRGSSSVKLERATLGSHSVHSLQYLSRYLKMDMRKMFHEEDSIPPHLLFQVLKSRLKVELCEDCGRMNETFSRQYKQLEKIGMEIKCSLELIRRKFKNGIDSNHPVQFQNLGTDANDLKGKMEIANALRTEAMGKCKRKLRRPSPLIKIQRLSTREVMAHQLKNRAHNPADCVNLVDNLAKLKDEIPTVHPDQNDMEEMDYIDDSQSNLQTSDADLADTGYDEEPSNESTMSNIKGVMQRIVVRGSADGTPISGLPNVLEQKRYTINPETGTLKCNLCSLEFRRSGFEYHYQNIHLGIKYKCNLCDKEFNQRPNYNKHHKRIHKGTSASFAVVTVSKSPVRENVRSSLNPGTREHQCDLCSLGFKSADDLQIHYSSVHPDVKYRCKICCKEFGQFSAYQQHGCNKPIN